MSLRNELFGNKEGVYKKLASDLHGNFSRGDFSNPVRVNIPYKNWTITADTFVTMDLINVSKGNPYGGNSEHTRIRVPFLKGEDLNFSITTATALNSFAKIFGAHDIKVGEEEFDKQFIIKGTNENKVKLIFSNSSVRRSLSEIGDINLVLRDHEGFLGTQLPENIYELFLKAEDVILDENKLKSFIQLFFELLDQLSGLGFAKKDNPNFKLF
jgi:hypothetical protein